MDNRKEITNVTIGQKLDNTIEDIRDKASHIGSVAAEKLQQVNHRLEEAGHDIRNRSRQVQDKAWDSLEEKQRQSDDRLSEFLERNLRG